MNGLNARIGWVRFGPARTNLTLRLYAEAYPTMTRIALQYTTVKFVIPIVNT